MRTVQFTVSSFAAYILITSAMSPAFAAEAVKTKEAATQRAHAEGYPLVSKAEQEPGAWDVWASRDGIAYDVKIDARDGSVIKATPVEDND